MSREAECIIMCLVAIIYLCVYRRHCHDLQVEKPFVTLHPLNRRDLWRNFLNNKKMNNYVC